MATDKPRGRREAAKADKTRRIVDAAEALIAEVGYDEMTMAAVAKDADVAIGTVFTYAATKAELLMMVTARRWRGQVAAALQQHRREDPGQAIRALLQPLVDTVRLEPQTSAAIARELLFGADGPHQREVVGLVAELEQAIAEILAGGTAGPQQLAGARLVVAGGLMEINRHRTGRSDEDLEELLTRTIGVVQRGCGQR